ncbi:uncharacterized protein TNCV_1236591 [Trichonephila clavipes]|nr:uncharacterized protein TNCV_1236591 [Trichonephila clavipes]
MSSHPHKWKTFVANRTSEIMEVLPTKHWRHVPIKENPTDIASRGIDPKCLPDCMLWWQGPPWLRLETSSWHKAESSCDEASNEHPHFTKRLKKKLIPVDHHKDEREVAGTRSFPNARTSFSLYSIHEDFYQKLWLTKTDWDSPIPKQLTKDWLRFQKAFNEINYLTVSRWVILTAENTVELHGFADASSLAYAAAIYCRQKHNGKIKVQLLVSKTKVAPVKQVSIPRLSCAVHIYYPSYLNRSYGH